MYIYTYIQLWKITKVSTTVIKNTSLSIHVVKENITNTLLKETLQYQIKSAVFVTFYKENKKYQL